MRKPRVVVLRAPGSNCDQETAAAWGYVGGEVELVHINELVRGEKELSDYQILTIPGGFTYGDDLGAGKLLANDFLYRLREPLQRFVEAGRPILGICNGFQVLVKMGLLSGATLYANDSGRFECRWVHLRSVNGGRCIWTRGIGGLTYLPVAHAEGKFVPAGEETLKRLADEDRLVCTYVDEGGKRGGYPVNPNGSVADIAGVCDETGLIFGLMPHPERHVLPYHHPRWTRRGEVQEGDGVVIFRNGIRYVSEA